MKLNTQYTALFSSVQDFIITYDLQYITVYGLIIDTTINLVINDTICLMNPIVELIVILKQSYQNFFLIHYLPLNKVA